MSGGAGWLGGTRRHLPPNIKNFKNFKNECGSVARCDSWVFKIFKNLKKAAVL